MAEPVLMGSGPQQKKERATQLYRGLQWLLQTILVSIQLLPQVGVTPKYYKGKHLVVYNASDQAGNFKICQFYVSVDGRLSNTFIP